MILTAVAALIRCGHLCLFPIDHRLPPELNERANSDGTKASEKHRVYTCVYIYTHIFTSHIYIYRERDTIGGVLEVYVAVAIPGIWDHHIHNCIETPTVLQYQLGFVRPRHWSWSQAAGQMMSFSMSPRTACSSYVSHGQNSLYEA